MCCLNAVIEQIQLTPERVVQGVVYAGNQITNFAGRAIISLGKITKSVDDCDTGLRLVQESWTLADLVQGSENATRPVLTAIGSIRSSINVTRVSRSIQYVTSGALYRDFVQEQVIPLITQLAFFAARVLSTIHWAVEQKFFSFEKLAETATRFGGRTAFAAVNIIKSTKLLDSLYLVAVGGLAVQEVQGIRAGQVSWSRLFSIASLTADVLSLSLSLFGLGNAKVLTSLGIAAAGFGLTSFFTTPGNGCL